MTKQLGFAAAFAALAVVSSVSAAELPGPVVPDGLGVNIHFTDPRPGEMAMLAGAGFTIVRMDFSWGATEREKGQYDFAAYDRLMAALAPHKIRALFILDYSNRHYDNNQSPASDEGRKAFARWAAAAAVHFRGRGILWEMYNEPNISFWRPEPKVDDYVKLALEVGKAIRAAAPDEIYIGPATSQIDMPFLEACFKAGLLEYWSAVSVHPYRQKPPETAAEEYARLRQLIDRYAPKGKQIPILSGEWGYSAAWKGYDEAIQGRMLPRQWMTNLAHAVPVSIWYDWHDDGPDPKEPEHHFGTVLHPYHEGRSPVYDPKPAYLAAKTLISTLAGFRFNKRLDVGSPDDHVYLFDKGEQLRLAAWSVNEKPHAVRIPASPGQFIITGHTGETLPPVAATAAGLELVVDGAPRYLVPQGPNDLLRLAAAWESVPGYRAVEVHGRSAAMLDLGNPLDRPIRAALNGQDSVEIQPGAAATLRTPLDLTRASDPIDVVMECRIDGFGRLAQRSRILVSNPLRVTFGALAAAKLTLRVENGSGAPLQGTVVLTDVEGLRLTETSKPVDLARGETQKDVTFALEEAAAREFRLGVEIKDREGRLQLRVPPSRREVVDDFAQYNAESLAAAWKVVPDGDAKVGSTQTVSLAPAPPGLPGAPVQALKINYSMEDGWKFIRLVPQREAMKRIEGRPKALGLWLHGDGSGHSPRLRFTDSTGQTFQPTAESISWTGWRYIELALDGAASGHWGGADDGVVHYPIRWDSLLLIDGTRSASPPRDVYLVSPMLVR